MLAIKEHLALRNNFAMTKNFLITKFDCTFMNLNSATALLVFPVKCWLNYFGKLLVYFLENILDQFLDLETLGHISKLF